MVRRGDGVFSEDDIASSPKRAEICSTRSALATTIDRVVRRRFFLGGPKNWGNCKEGILVEKKVLILQLDDTFGFSPHGNLYVFLLVVVIHTARGRPAVSELDPALLVRLDFGQEAQIAEGPPRRMDEQVEIIATAHRALEYVKPDIVDATGLEAVVENLNLVVHDRVRPAHDHAGRGRIDEAQDDEAGQGEQRCRQEGLPERCCPEEGCRAARHPSRLGLEAVAGTPHRVQERTRIGLVDLRAQT